MFAHGLLSDGSTWSTMKPTLESQLQIVGLAPTLGWSLSYATQADNLHTALAGFSNVAAVTHSNGGVLTRRYLTAGSSPLVTGHISINSPHTGAPLAANAVNGLLGGWALEIIVSITEPFNFYGTSDPYFMGGIWSNTAAQLLLSLGNIDRETALIGYATAFWAAQFFGAIPAILPEMVPGSSLLQAQLTPGALATEASRAAQRVSISSELNLNGQPYSVFWPNPSAMESAVNGLLYFAIDQYDYYYWHPDPFLQAQALQWIWLASTLAWVPADWATLNGSLISATPVYRGPTFYTAYLNDGIVPWDRSAYPGGTSQANMPRGLYGDLRHTAQTSHSAMVSRVRDVLQNQLGILVRPPPFIASISGANVVPPHTTCNYAASVSGGSPPHTYEWYAGTTLVGTSSTLSISVPPPGFDLSLVVRDANSLVRPAMLSLTTDNYSSGCF